MPPVDHLTPELPRDHYSLPERFFCAGFAPDFFPKLFPMSQKPWGTTFWGGNISKTLTTRSSGFHLTPRAAKTFKAECRVSQKANRRVISKMYLDSKTRGPPRERLQRRTHDHERQSPKRMSARDIAHIPQPHSRDMRMQ